MGCKGYIAFDSKIYIREGNAQVNLYKAICAIIAVECMGINWQESIKFFR